MYWLKKASNNFSEKAIWNPPSLGWITKPSSRLPTFTSRPLSNRSLYLAATNDSNVAFSFSERRISMLRFPPATSHFFTIVISNSWIKAFSSNPILAISPATSPATRFVIACFKAVIAWRALNVISDSAFFFKLETSVSASAFICATFAFASAIIFSASCFAWLMIFSASCRALSTPSL